MTHQVGIGQKRQEVHDHAAQQFVERCRALREGVTDCRQDSGPGRGVGIVDASLFPMYVSCCRSGLVIDGTYMELGKVATRVRGGELAQACRSNVASGLFLILRVLEQRRPKHVRDSFQLTMRTMGDDLPHRVSTMSEDAGRHGEDLTSFRAWRESRRFA